MRWYKSFSDETDDFFIHELINKHGLKGFYFWRRLLDIMTQHFDVWNPGCSRLNKSWFFMQFGPHVRTDRTCLKILDFLMARYKVFYLIQDNWIILYFPDLEKRADKYTTTCLIDANKNQKKKPIDAGILRTFCKSFVANQSKNPPNFDKDFVENEKLKGKIVGR